MLSRYSLGTIFAAAVLAQAPVMPELPKGPAKPGFDIARFALTPVGTFETFYVTTAAGRLALITDQMTYHHIAQGRARNRDWMAAF